MKKRTFELLSVFLFAVSSLLAQQQPYTVTRTSFCTDNYNEFAPTFYKNGIVFCTDRGQAINNQGQAVVKMYYADTISGNSKSRLFSKNLKTKLNDGPATFNRNEDTIYYSRNLVVDGNLRILSTYRNKLGLFYAGAEEKGWGRAREIRFNTEWFNITMPCMAPDGKRLYFASDKPDGFGGLDIYYSICRNGYWEDPVNLGPEINTAGNETYPFINETGELFFTSDGHGGLGGKDIYVTRQKDDGWYAPVRLAAPLNSEFDDFGIITTPAMDKGYFSSNRGKSIDIYRFTSDVPQVWFSEPQKQNVYCFSVSDSGIIKADASMLQYLWNFGDNTSMNGTAVYHCFPGPGRYKITMDIVDPVTGNVFFRKRSYDIEIIDYEQPFITSPDYVTKGQTVEFDGMQSYCPGYNITGYFWDFGDGTQYTGAKLGHTYNKSGEYEVRLGLMLSSKETGDILKKAVTKKIMVFDNSQEMKAYIDSTQIPEKDNIDFRSFENVRIDGMYSAEDELAKEAVFQVEILSSKTKMELSSPVFRSVPQKYTVSEVYDSVEGRYSYVIDQQMTLMATYPAYREIIDLGYRNATIRLHVLTDPAARELNILKRNYGVMTDTYFDSRDRLVTNAYLMLDQVVMLMNKYPAMKLEIGVHTDNQGTNYLQQSSTQKRAQVIVNYLVDRGINADRLVARGYGGTRPVAPNTTWLEQRQNRRVEFTIIE